MSNLIRRIRFPDGAEATILGVNEDETGYNAINDTGQTINHIESIILENTDKKYKYIARDSDGVLYLYEEKPCKKYIDETYSIWNTDINPYHNTSIDSFTMFDHLFKNIKWEDEEPYKFR